MEDEDDMSVENSDPEFDDEDGYEEVEESEHQFGSEDSHLEEDEWETESEGPADALEEPIDDFIEDDGNVDLAIPDEHDWEDDEMPVWDDPLDLQGLHGLDSRFFSMQFWPGDHPQGRPNLNSRDHFSVNLTQNITNNETYQSLLQRLRWLRTTYNDPFIPIDMNTFWRRMGLNEEFIHFKHMCEDCRDVISETNTVHRECGCGQCGLGKNQQPLATFVYMDIRAQLVDLLRTPGMARDLRYRFTRSKKNEEAYEDIYDGQGYREICQEGGFLYVENYENLAENINFQFTLWLDHVSLAKGSPAKACPILLQINELSPHARKRHIILAGV